MRVFNTGIIREVDGMSRLTDNNKGNPILKAVGHENCSTVCDNEMFCDMCPIQEAVDKLCYYENLEEQGKLVELKEGQWELRAAYSDGVLNTVACSVCGTFQPVGCWDYTKYCPNCGAKMNEVKK